MTESKTPPPAETAADKAIREALESVERLERDANPALDDADSLRVVGGNDQDPAGDSAYDSAPKKSASDALLEATLKAKGEMQDVLQQTQKEAKDLFDRLARVSADFDNFKKRVNREKADAIKFANEGVFKEMLPVLDNMLRAVQAASQQQQGGEIADGVRLVSRQFEDVLAKMGAVAFSALGEVFDPARHEAVGARPHDEVPAQHVCEEYQRGYMLHDRLLRPALVIVSSGPDSSATADGGSPTEH